MPPLKPDIDISRRAFIKASFVFAGAFVLGKISGLLPTSAISASSRMSPSDIKKYQNTRYGFSFLYPSDLAIETFDEEDGAATITFQNIEKAEGFQIFIEPQVSEKHPKQNASSGVRESLAPIVVGGVMGDAFYGVDAALGATREVRFAHGGFLYEITTLKPLDTHLDAIIQTWKFA